MYLDTCKNVWLFSNSDINSIIDHQYFFYYFLCNYWLQNVTFENFVPLFIGQKRYEFGHLQKCYAICKGTCISLHDMLMFSQQVPASSHTEVVPKVKLPPLKLFSNKVIHWVKKVKIKVYEIQKCTWWYFPHDTLTHLCQNWTQIYIKYIRKFLRTGLSLM